MQLLAPVSVAPPSRDPRAAGLESYWASGLLKALLSWLVVGTIFRVPGTGQMDCKRGNKALEGVWALVPLAPNL